MSNVVFLEDDVSLTEDLEFFLDLNGYSVKSFNRSDDFINQLDFFDERVVFVLDIMMRKGRVFDYPSDKEVGEFVYEMIREKYPKNKVIVISAKDKEDISIDFSDFNTFFMLKPVRHEAVDLLEIIKS